MDHPQLPHGARHRVNPAGAPISSTWYGSVGHSWSRWEYHHVASSLQIKCLEPGLCHMSVGHSWSRWEYHRVASSLQIKCLEPGLCHMSVGHSWSRWEYHRVASSLQIRCLEPHVGGLAPHWLMLPLLLSAESPGVDSLLIQDSVLDTGAATSPHPGISLLGLIIS